MEALPVAKAPEATDMYEDLTAYKRINQRIPLHPAKQNICPEHDVHELPAE